MKKVSDLNKKIIITAILVLLVVIAGYIYFNGLSSNSVPYQPFHGPTSVPHVTGPKTLPPSS